MACFDFCIFSAPPYCGPHSVTCQGWNYPGNGVSESGQVKINWKFEERKTFQRKTFQAEQFTVDLGAHPPYHQPPEGFKVWNIGFDIWLSIWWLLAHFLVLLNIQCFRCQTVTLVLSLGRTLDQTGTPAWRAAPPSTSPPSPPTWTSSTPTAISRKSTLKIFLGGQN